MKNNLMQTDDKTLHLAGIYPPIPTPFDEKGQIAVKALKDNLAFLNRFDLRGIVVMGSNGEYVMLSEKEKTLLMETARAAISPDMLMIAGTGCQSTTETIALTRKAADIGADAALVITPSYYRKAMTPEALSAHFRAVADASPIPVILYNMPANTGIDLEADTIAALAQHPNIIGIKDSGGNIVKMGDIRRMAGPSFQVLAGSAGFLLPALSVGAVGGILALANIAPTQSIAIHKYFLEGDHADALDLQLRMIPVNSAVTARWGIPALKAAMDFLGLYGGPVRPPLMPLPEETRKLLETILTEGGILK
jgi:4-hydroxy-2-oxoglutarate aldolase